MATRKNKFLVKRSNVAGKKPTSSDLILGELALNTADVKLYASGTTSNSILPIGWDRIARTGDTMTGTLIVPTVSATTYNGNGSNLTGIVSAFTYTNTTNKLSIKRRNTTPLDVTVNSMSGLTINGNLIVTGYTESTSIIEPSNPSSTKLRLFSENVNGFNNYNVIDSNGFKINLSRDTVFTVTNKESTTLNVGEVVYILSGISGTSICVKRAKADSETTADGMGVIVSGNIAANARGRMLKIGETDTGFNTSSFSAGNIVYTSPTTAGGLTNIKPQYPYIPQRVGVINVSNASTGSMVVDIKQPQPYRLPRAYESSWIRLRATNGTVSPTGASAGAFGTPSENNDDTTNYTNYLTSVALGFAGIESATFAEFRGNHNLVMTAVIKMPATITNYRMWVGFVSQSILNLDNQLGNNVCFRFSTVAGDTGWTPIVDNGTQTVGTTIGTVVASTQYKLVIRIDQAAGKCYFSVNGGVEQTVNAVPTSGAELGFCCEISNTAAGARSFDFSRLEIVHN